MKERTNTAGYSLRPGERLYEAVQVKEMEEGERILRAYTKGQDERFWNDSWEREAIVVGPPESRWFTETIYYLVARMPKYTTEPEWGELSP